MFKRQRSNFAGSLAADVASLFRVWWKKDRIRSSPSQGKLLRLAPGAVLSANGSLFEVVQRDVIETAQGSVLRYRCRGNDARTELWVTVAPVPTIVWCCGAEEQRLVTDDVEVWSEGIKSN